MCNIFRVIFVSLCTLSLCLGMLSHVLSKQEGIIKEGAPFPEIPLPPPDGPKDAAYLGIRENVPFTIKYIRADLVLVEILNVYCVTCQKQVPEYNKLYDLIESNPETKGRIKMVGIGVANGNLEVRRFRERFGVLFPIFPDPDFVMHRATGKMWSPFSIFVRQDFTGQEGLVLRTQQGVKYKYGERFRAMQSMIGMDLATIREKERKSQPKAMHVKAILTEEEVQAIIKRTFAKEGDDLTRFETVQLESSGVVYVGVVQRDGQSKRLFGKVISRPPLCDVCDDTHFIYVFEATGKILHFVPLLLAKYANAPWDETDVAMIRERILGKHVHEPFVYDAKVDAVSSATMTSAVIFDALNDGQVLYNELKKKGLN